MLIVQRVEADVDVIVDHRKHDSARVRLIRRIRRDPVDDRRAVDRGLARSRVGLQARRQARMHIFQISERLPVTRIALREGMVGHALKYGHASEDADIAKLHARRLMSRFELRLRAVFRWFADHGFEFRFAELDDLSDCRADLRLRDLIEVDSLRGYGCEGYESRSQKSFHKTPDKQERRIMAFRLARAKCGGRQTLVG